MNATKLYSVSGRDIQNSKRDLLHDGFVYVSGYNKWFGTEEAVATYKARGFRTKIFFTEAVCDSRSQEIIENALGVN